LSVLYNQDLIILKLKALLLLLSPSPNSH